MTEPNNPIFEDEKEFLERKKLEYERALRGDVEEIKEQTIHVGKVALVGAGVAGGIWLLVKAFSGGKHKKKHKKHKHRPEFEDYAGFNGYESYDDDDHDQELDSLATAYNSPEYAYDHADRYDAGDGFYQAGNAPDYFQDQDEEGVTDADADDNGLSDYPDFPAHSSAQHGYDIDDETSVNAANVDTTYGSHADVYHTDEDHGYDTEEADSKSEEESVPAHSFASANSYQARPYDDSRRLPESDSFADSVSRFAPAKESKEEKPAAAASTEAPEPKKSWLIPAVVAFAKTETGKVIAAQAAAMAMAFITKKVQDIRTEGEAKTGKNADLAPSPALSGDSPAVWPATTAAQDASAAAHHNDIAS